MKLERAGEAIDAFRRYLAEVEDIQPDERAQVERDLKLIEGSVVQLELRVAPEGAMIVDERVPIQGGRVRNQYGPVSTVILLRLRPGEHQLTVRSEGYLDGKLTLSLEPGGKVAREIALQREKKRDGVAPPSTESSTRVPAAVWAGIAVTGALGVGAAITGGLAAANHGKYKDAAAAGDATRADDLAKSGKSLNIAADVLIGATAAGAVTTLVLGLALPRTTVAPSARGRVEGDEPSRHVMVSPWIGDEAAGFACIGAF
jgi:hypothetical protein